jgi:hypothetical protein
VSDELGNIWNISIHTQGEHHRINPFEKKIFAIEYVERFCHLLLMTETGIEVIKIKRGVSVQNLIGSHKGPILDIAEIDPQKVLKAPTKEPPRLFSTSLDNTIRQWGIVENEALGLFENEVAGEIWYSLNYV